MHALSPRGVLASVASSVFFGVLYFFTPQLAPLSAESVWAIRVVFAVPCIAIVLLSLRDWHLFTETAARIRRRPLLLLGILASGALLAAQLWVFAWGPLHGRGLQVALGYFLLPLVLVLVGKLVYRDQLRWWQWLAAGCAAVGVIFELVRVGGISWETLLVALGYPVYFVLRRSLGTNHMGGQLWEMSVALPLAIALTTLELTRGTAFAENPRLWWLAPAVAITAAIALLLYIVASKLLPLSTFGLLSYLEPALLMVAALLLGETIAREELFSYGAIWAAVLIVVAGGVVEVLRGRRKHP